MPAPDPSLSETDLLPLGSRHEVEILDLAFGGEGVARIGDLVVFVPFVIPGERVEVEITETKKTFRRATLLRILTPSPERTLPRCPYFGECGGCQYQHLNYEAQIRFKQKQVADLLARIGKFPKAVVSPVIKCPQPYEYRNRIMIRSQWNKVRQGLEFGFLSINNRFVVDIESCAIADPLLNEEITKARRHPPHKGGIKVALRVLPTGWEVPPDSFFQNNFHLLGQLVACVRERLEAAGTRSLLDLYCGVGFFAIELAGSVDRFVGVELDQRAIQAARRNLAQRNLTNGEFVAGASEVELPGLVGKFQPSDCTVLIDPPRTGCARSLLECLRSARPKQILYISCHPATLARDLNVLCGNGVYELVQVTPIDMFPQTQHVECVVDLRALPSPPELGDLSIASADPSEHTRMVEGLPSTPVMQPCKPDACHAK